MGYAGTKPSRVGDSPGVWMMMVRGQVEESDSGCPEVNVREMSYPIIFCKRVRKLDDLFPLFV